MPTPNDLFNSVWQSKLFDTTTAKPGTRGWDQEAQNRYWARVWLHCVELCAHLGTCEARIAEIETEIAALEATAEP